MNKYDGLQFVFVIDYFFVCVGAIVLAECLADNEVMIRLDLRDNPHIGSAGLLALHLAMKMNTSLTVLNLDLSVAHSSSLKV